jgi:MerR family transcriptional regulator, light-induced transcriptional regulator
MWQTGSADIGSEHFISNLFREKLIASIDSLPLDLKPKRKRVILFLPENELHEIGLLYFQYLIKKLGHESIYLGQTTPLFSVVNVNSNWKADIIITGLMSGSPGLKKDDFLIQLSNTFQAQKILVAGGLAETAVIIKLPNVFPLISSEDLKSFL